MAKRVTRLGGLLAAYQRRDPAARSKLEIFLLYPGVHAVLWHRVAHWLYVRRHFFLARWVSQHARKKTGIEIHPGATIGRRLVIDHGMGIVIGETAEIGDDCLLYQGVTLGGTVQGWGQRTDCRRRGGPPGGSAQLYCRRRPGPHRESERPPGFLRRRCGSDQRPRPDS